MVLLKLKTTIAAALPITIFLLSLFARSRTFNLEYVVESALGAAAPYMATTAGIEDIPDIPCETQIQRPPSSAEILLQA